MIHNHHIAAQLAAERQRDLLAAGRGWRFSHLFRRRGAELEPVAPAEAPQASAGDEAIDAALPVGLAGAAASRRPELRIRCAPTAPRRAGSARSLERRVPERTGS